MKDNDTCPCAASQTIAMPEASIPLTCHALRADARRFDKIDAMEALCAGRIR